MTTTDENYSAQPVVFEVELPSEKRLTCNTFVHCWGNEQNPAVVLLHGFMQSGKTWEPLALELAKTYYVIAPDLIGHGKTTLSNAEEPMAYSLPMYIDQIEVVISLLCPQAPVAMIGYSMGGRMAALFATSYPDKVSTVILESAGLGPANGQERAERTEKNNVTVEKLNTMLFPDFVEYWQELPLFASQKELPEIVRAQVYNERLNNDPEALALSVEFAGAHRMTNLRLPLCSTSQPVLYLAGSKDVTYTEVAQSLAQKAESFNATEHIETKIVENAGHNIHLEKPEEFLSLVKEYLAAHYQ